MTKPDYAKIIKTAQYAANYGMGRNKLRQILNGILEEGTVTEAKKNKQIIVIGTFDESDRPLGWHFKHNIVTRVPLYGPNGEALHGGYTDDELHEIVAQAEAVDKDVTTEAAFDYISPVAALRLGNIIRETGKLTYNEAMRWIGCERRMVQMHKALVDSTGMSNHESAIDWIESKKEPIPMLLFCPNCLAQHIDAPNAKTGWNDPPHKKHECQECGWDWRPADVATRGVASLSDLDVERARIRPRFIEAMRVLVTNSQTTRNRNEELQVQLKQAIKERDEELETNAHLQLELEGLNKSRCTYQDKAAELNLKLNHRIQHISELRFAVHSALMHLTDSPMAGSKAWVIERLRAALDFVPSQANKNIAEDSKHVQTLSAVTKAMQDFGKTLESLYPAPVKVTTLEQSVQVLNEYRHLGCDWALVGQTVVGTCSSHTPILFSQYLEDDVAIALANHFNGYTRWVEKELNRRITSYNESRNKAAEEWLK